MATLVSPRPALGSDFAPRGETPRQPTELAGPRRWVAVINAAGGMPILAVRATGSPAPALAHIGLIGSVQRAAAAAGVRLTALHGDGVALTFTEEAGGVVCGSLTPPTDGDGGGDGSAGVVVAVARALLGDGVWARLSREPHLRAARTRLALHAPALRAALAAVDCAPPPPPRAAALERAVCAAAARVRGSHAALLAGTRVVASTPSWGRLPPAARAGLAALAAMLPCVPGGGGGGAVGGVAADGENGGDGAEPLCARTLLFLPPPPGDGGDLTGDGDGADDASGSGNGGSVAADAVVLPLSLDVSPVPADAGGGVAAAAAAAAAAAVIGVGLSALAPLRLLVLRPRRVQDSTPGASRGRRLGARACAEAAAVALAEAAGAASGRGAAAGGGRVLRELLVAEAGAVAPTDGAPAAAAGRHDDGLGAPAAAWASRVHAALPQPAGSAGGVSGWADVGDASWLVA